jgi:hypothetical protein
MRRIRTPLVALASFAIGTLGAPARPAEPSDAAPEPAPAPEASAAASSEDDTVYTFYGLLALERDPGVSDAEKVRQWQAFVKRTEEQLRYAREAVQRWKDAGRRRAIESALAAEDDDATTAPERMQAWLQAAAAQSEATPRAKAEKRAAYWKAEHTRALVERARRVEAEREPKIERIAAWLEVTEWQESGPAAQGAGARIRALRDQLFREARSIDAIPGVDPATKLEAWRDVLRGAPTDSQRAKAEARVKALSR